MAINLAEFEGFGAVAAEDDKILLEYFLATDEVKKIENGDSYVVLGRKGAGKTAIVRHFTEGEGSKSAVALNLRSYPWNVHASRIDKGSDAIDAYVASWKYLIAVQAAAWALKASDMQHHPERMSLEGFLNENYGGTNPKLAEIIRPKRLKVSKLSIAPSVMGNQLGGVDLDRDPNDLDLGLELDALTDSIISSTVAVCLNCKLNRFFMHFDELDAGLDSLDNIRKSMLVGLIIAIRNIRKKFDTEGANIFPVLYLRTDIWDDLSFSDKNKVTQTKAMNINWNAESLKSLIEERLKRISESNVSWSDAIDNQLMRGSQPKWNHIVSRTLKRPRDVIQFLNVALGVLKNRETDPVFLQIKIL